MTAPASPPVTVTVAVAVPTQDHPSMCTPNRPVSTTTIADAPSSSSLRAHGTFRRKSPYSSTPATSTRAPPAASPPAVSPQRSDSLFTTASSSPPAHSVFAPIRDGAGEAVCAPRDTTVVYVAASLPTSSFPDSVTLPFRSWTTLCAGPGAGERPGSPSSVSSSPPDGLSSIVEACAGWRAPSVCLDSHLPLAPPPSPSLLDVSPEIGCTVRATHTYSFSRPNACTGSRRASGCVDAPSSATTNVTTDVSDDTVFGTSPSSPSVPFSVPHPKPISDPLSVSPSCSSSCCARAPECERSDCGAGSFDPAPVVEPPMAAPAHGSSRATFPLPPSPAPHPSDSIPCLMQPCKSAPTLFAQNRTAPARPSRSLGNASPVVTTSPHHHSEFSGNVGAVVHENSGPPIPERQEVAATGSVSNSIFSLFRGAVPAMRSAAGLPPLSLSPAADDAAVSRLFLSQCSALAVSFSHHHSRCFPAEPTPDSTAPMPSASSVTASHTIPTTSAAPATSTSAVVGQVGERSVMSRPQRHRDTQGAAPLQPRTAPVARPPPPPPPPYQPQSDARSQQQHNAPPQPAPMLTRGPMLPPQPAPIRVGGIVLPQQPLVPSGTFPLPPGKAHYGPGGAPGPAMAHHPAVCPTPSAAVPSHVHGGQQYAPPPPYGAAIASAPVFFCVPAPPATTHAPATLSSGGRRGKRGCRAGRQVKSRRPGSNKSEPDDEEEGSTGEVDEAGPHSS